MSMRLILAACAAGLLSLPAGAEQNSSQPKPFATFEAKRVTVPKRGTRVKLPQIAIVDTVRVAKSPKPDAPKETGKSPGRYAWFWDNVSPAREVSGAQRLQDALLTLETKGQVAAPRLSTIRQIAKDRGRSILASTVGTDVSPALVLAVISVESAGRSDAVSPAGAAGLMQLMPATAERFGVTDRSQADQNIAGGVKYLDWLMAEFKRDPILALAGYNAGEGAVRSHNGVPPYAETRDYVPKVLSAFKVARALCKTPPELITDGCVLDPR